MDDALLMRYSRQILLPEIDIAGQEALARARVLIVGAGGLGNPAALYLAGAGVGELVIADDDRLEVSNLHRQVAYRACQINSNKALALVGQLRQLNDNVRYEALETRLDAAALERQVPQADVVLDCTDNFATRTDLNRACHRHRVPLVSGAAIRWQGQLAVFDFRQAPSPCYACLYGEGAEPDTLCAESGVAGPVVGVIGTLQALAAIRLLCGLPGGGARLHRFDGLRGHWREAPIPSDPSCPVCRNA